MPSDSSRPWMAAIVGVVQRGKDFRFTLKASQALRVGSQSRWQHLHRHVALQLRVGRPVDLPHPALADLGGDLVRAEAGAGSEGQTVGV